VCLLCEDDLHIAGEAIQDVVAFHFVCNLVAVLDPLLDSHVQVAGLVDQFLGMTHVTFVLDDFALAAALVALSLVLDDAVAHILGGDGYALAFALIASFRLPIFGSSPLALGANDFLVLLQFLHFSSVDVLE